MNQEKLKTLEQTLTESEDFGAIFGYFMDNFGESPLFIEQSERNESPFIIELVNYGASSIFKKTPVEFSNTFLLQHSGFNIIHGGGQVEGCFFTIFYCNNINKGLLAVLKDGIMQMGRMTPKSMNDIILDSNHVDNTIEVEKHFVHKNVN